MRVIWYTFFGSLCILAYVNYTRMGGPSGPSFLIYRDIHTILLSFTAIPPSASFLGSSLQREPDPLKGSITFAVQLCYSPLSLRGHARISLPCISRLPHLKDRRDAQMCVSRLYLVLGSWRAHARLISREPRLKKRSDAQTCVNRLYRNMIFVSVEVGQ